MKKSEVFRDNIEWFVKGSGLAENKKKQLLELVDYVIEAVKEEAKEILKPKTENKDE